MCVYVCENLNPLACASNNAGFIDTKIHQENSNNLVATASYRKSQHAFCRLSIDYTQKA